MFFFFLYIVCAVALGMESGKISNSAIRYSTAKSAHPGYNARLNNAYTWNPQYSDELAALKIDLGPHKKKLTALAVQSAASGFLTKFELSYSEEGWSWRHWVEDAREKVFNARSIY